MATGITAILQTLYGFYNAVFHPLLATSPYLALGFFSAALAGLFSLIYWYLLDIEKANEIKEKLSERQDKMKEARKNDNSDKASEHMQKTMELNQRLMKLNLKPMVATMVFVALIFPWLGSVYSPAIELHQSSEDTWEGNLSYAKTSIPVEVINGTDKKVNVNEQEIEVGDTFRAFGIEWETKYFGEKKGGFFSSGGGTVLKVSAEFVKLPFSIPLAGGALNWLGFYILIAMPLTFILRKALGVA